MQRFKTWIQKFEWIWLGGILLVALCLRLYYARTFHIWFDEVTLILGGYRYSYITLFFLDYWDVSHPPLFNLFVKWWMGFSVDPTFLRLPSVVAGSLSLVYLYLIVKRFFGGRLLALFATLLAATSNVMIWLSIYVRPYGFEQLFVLGFLYHWLVLFSDKKSISSAIFVLIYSTLGILTDYSFLWLLGVIDVAYVIHLVVSFKKWKQHDFVVGGYLFLCHIPFLLWLPIFLEKLKVAMGYSGGSIENMGGGFLYALSYPLREWLGIPWQVALVLMLLTIIGCIVYGLFSLGKHSQVIIVGLGLVSSVSYVVSYLTSPVYIFRNFFVFYYGVYILTSLLIVYIYRRWKWAGVGLMLVTTLLVSLARKDISGLANTFDATQAARLRAKVCEVSQQNYDIISYDSTGYGFVHQFLNDYYFKYDPFRCVTKISTDRYDIYETDLQSFVYIQSSKQKNLSTALDARILSYYSCEQILEKSITSKVWKCEKK